MKSSKKFSKVLLTLAVLALALCTLFACSGRVTVSFNSDGGTSVSSVTLNAGEAVSAPETPTREGYSFAGWRTENGEMWNFTAPVNKTMVLTAAWVKNSQENTATVSFDLKGGDTSSYASSLTVQKGAVLKEPTAPVRLGYDFAGWFYLGEKFDFGSRVIAGDITLVAQWELAVFDISYELSGGKLEAPVTEYTTLEEVKISAPTRDGYDFLGWTYEGASAPVASFVLPVGSYGDLALTAAWQLKEYGVSYELSGALLPEDVTLTESYNAESESFTAPALTKEFYEFLGWQANGEGEPVLEFTVEKGSFGDVSLVAVFKPIEYKISYTLGEGAVNNAANPLFTTVESAEFTLLAPTLRGYKLAGWQIGGEGEVLSEAVIPAGATEELSFTAVWEKATYDITYFDGNGKTHDGDSLPLSFTMDNLPVKLPALYLNNKCFVSWYADADFTTPVTEITECENTTLYARFEDTSNGLVFSYNSESESYDVTGYAGSDAVVYVPEFYKGIRVTSISTGAFEGAKFSEIYLPESINTIGERAFFSAKNLKKINLGIAPKLEKIEKNAFSGTGIESFEAPETLNYLGEGVFLGCASLKSLNLDKTSIDEIYASTFEGTSLESFTVPASVKYINAKAFYNAASLKSVSFAEGSNLSIIYENAFKNCLALESFTAPASVSSIKESAFENCAALVSLSFEKGSELNFIGASAFRACYSLVSVSLPEKLITVSDYAFYLDYALNSVSFAPNAELLSIGKCAFSYTAVKDLIFPKNLNTVSESAFAYCSELENVVFNEKLSSIEKLAFDACAKLNKVNLSENTYAAENSFNGCLAVEELTINKFDPTAIFGGALPSGIKRVTILNESVIKEGIFKGCTELEYVKLPFVGIIDYGTSIYKVCDSHADSEKEEEQDNLCEKCSRCVKHPDEDKDGFCDDCAACITHTKDENKDGKCDACLLCLTHVDIDFDANCDVCGARYKFMPASADGSDVKTFLALFGGEAPKSLKTVEITGGSYIADYSFKDCAYIETIILPVTHTTAIGRGAFAGCESLSSLQLTLALSGKKDQDNAEITYEVETEIDGKVVKETKTETVSTKTLSYIFDRKIPVSLREVYLFSGTEKIAKLSPDVFVGSSVRNVTLAGFDAISERAFYGVKTLTSLDISASNITKIGDYAFAGVFGMKAVNIPASVKSIGCYAFEDSGIETVSFAENSALTEIMDCAFSNCDSLSRISLPAGVTELAMGLFYDCDALTEFTLCDTVEAIGNYAFEGCKLLKSVNYGENSKLSSLGILAFSGTAIESFTFPLAVTSVPIGLFRDCEALTEVKFTLPKEGEEYTGALGIQNYAFENTGLTSIRLPYYTEGIGTCAFMNCSDLKSVSFGADSQLRIILDGAFENCTSLESIKIPKGVKKIMSGVFYNCRSLKSVSFAEGSELSQIGYSAFENCLALEAIELPRSVTAIDPYAFANCFSLKDLKFALTEVIPAEEEGAEPSVIPANLAYIRENAFKNCDSLVSVTLPNSLVYLGELAFYSCDKLEAVKFEEGIELEVISANTFLNCVSLKSFDVPDSVECIYEGAFQGCSALEAISFGENSKLVAIDAYAFMNCAALKSFEAPASLVYIGTEAFKGCLALESVAITTGIRFIENYAFENTPKLVITVTYFEEGAHLAWLAMETLGAYWNTDGNEIEFVYVMYLLP